MKLPVAAAASTVQRAAPAHLGTHDHLGDVLDHPALAGFARLLLPRSDAGIDRSTRLGDFGSLLP